MLRGEECVEQGGGQPGFQGLKGASGNEGAAAGADHRGKLLMETIEAKGWSLGRAREIEIPVGPFPDGGPGYPGDMPVGVEVVGNTR